MTRTARLLAPDREFLRLVSEAAASNPFGDRYLDLLRTIAGCDASVPHDECLVRMERSVHDRVRKLEADMQRTGSARPGVFSLAHNVATQDEVQPTLDRLSLYGGRVLVPASAPAPDGSTAVRARNAKGPTRRGSKWPVEPESLPRQ